MSMSISPSLWVFGLTTVPLRSRPIRTISSSKFTTPRSFYRRCGKTPVIITDHYIHNATVQALTPTNVEALLAHVHVDAYVIGTNEKVNMSLIHYIHHIRRSRHHINNIANGHDGCHNTHIQALAPAHTHGDHTRTYLVLDSSIVNESLSTLIPIPSYFSPSTSLFNYSSTSDYATATTPFVHNLSVLPKGHQMMCHVDSYGMEGWSLCVYGKSRWRLWAPQHRHVLTDVLNRQPVHLIASSSSTTRFTYNSSPIQELLPPCSYECILYPGELIWYPPGWSHEVTMLEETMNVGGGMLTPFMLPLSTTSWLFDRALSVSGYIYLPHLIHDYLRFIKSKPHLFKDLTCGTTTSVSTTTSLLTQFTSLLTPLMNMVYHFIPYLQYDKDTYPYYATGACMDGIYGCEHSLSMIEEWECTQLPRQILYEKDASVISELNRRRMANASSSLSSSSYHIQQASHKSKRERRNQEVLPDKNSSMNLLPYNQSRSTPRSDSDDRDSDCEQEDDGDDDNDHADVESDSESVGRGGGGDGKADKEKDKEEWRWRNNEETNYHHGDSMASMTLRVRSKCVTPQEHSYRASHAHASF